MRLYHPLEHSLFFGGGDGMKIKINDTWYDDETDKVCIIFDDYQLDFLRSSTKEMMPKNRVISGVFEDDEDAREWADE